MTDVGRTLVRTDYVKLYIKLWFLSFLHLTSFFSCWKLPHPKLHEASTTTPIKNHTFSLAVYLAVELGTPPSVRHTVVLSTNFIIGFSNYHT